MHFIYLEGEFEQLVKRLERRPDHFFGPNLLATQFEALEPPHTALVIDLTLKPEVIVDWIRRELAI